MDEGKDLKVTASPAEAVKVWGPMPFPPMRVCIRVALYGARSRLFDITFASQHFIQHRTPKAILIYLIEFRVTLHVTVPELVRFLKASA